MDEDAAADSGGDPYLDDHDGRQEDRRSSSTASRTAGTARRDEVPRSLREEEAEDKANLLSYMRWLSVQKEQPPVYRRKSNHALERRVMICTS